MILDGINEKPVPLSASISLLAFWVCGVPMGVPHVFSRVMGVSVNFIYSYPFRQSCRCRDEDG